jgi:hypothetical protein
MIMRRSTIGIAVLALSLAPATIAAQQVAYAASAVAELDSTTRAVVMREVARAQTRGLPVQPLVAKVREGQIKRAAPDRIRNAVVALAARLDSARAALGANANAAELVAGADAIAAGVGVPYLRAVRSAAGARDAAAPLGALAQLVASGIAPKRATEMIVELLKRDAGERAMLAFGLSVEADVGAGVPAEESALFRLRAIEAQGIGNDRLTVSVPASGLDPSSLNNGGGGGGGSGGSVKRRP